MSFRIYRERKWIPDPNQRLRMGGVRQMILVHSDVLQALTSDGWRPIPVVESDLPTKPHQRITDIHLNVEEDTLPLVKSVVGQRWS